MPEFECQAMVEVFESIVDGLMEQGYALSTDFLPQELVAKIQSQSIAKKNAGAFRAAGIGKGAEFAQVESIRRDEILWIENETLDPVERAFLDHVSQFIHYLNRTCYTGLREAEFHYACYAPGSFYKRHLDRFRGDDARRYSVVCYFNPNWQPGDGGELVIYAGEEAITVQPKAGTVVIFESRKLEHEVLLSHKDRYSLTGWLKG